MPPVTPVMLVASSSSRSFRSNSPSDDAPKARTPSLERRTADLGAALFATALRPLSEGALLEEEEEEGATNDSIIGLRDLLAQLKLTHYEGRAVNWCRRKGAETVEDVQRVWEEFASDLDLRPLERRRLEKVCVQALVSMPKPVKPGPSRGAAWVSVSAEARFFGPAADPQKYAILETLGAGATAKVFKCRLSASGEAVFAVKTIGLLKLRRQPNYAQIEEMLHQEIAIQLSLRHPRVVSLVDVVEGSDSLRIVLEFLAGGSLDDFLVKRGPLPEHQASSVFSQLADGLQYIHLKGIAHGDLKPANVLLVNDCCPLDVKLADFGHSKVAGDCSSSPQAGVGTPLYMAPELCSQLYITGREAVRPLEARSADLWSLGVLLYVVLVGSCPFRGRGAELEEEIRRGIFSFWSDGPLPPPSRQAQSLVRSLLVVDPTRRASLRLCLVHPFVSGGTQAALGRELLKVGLSLAEDETAIEERYLLSRMPDAQAQLLRQDLRKWMLKFRYPVMVKGLEVVADYGTTASVDVGKAVDACRELLEIMSFHTAAKRPAHSGLERLVLPMPPPGPVLAPEEPAARSEPPSASAQENGFQAQAQESQAQESQAPGLLAEGEDAARQRRLAARREKDQRWNLSGRSGVEGELRVDDRFRAQEAELDSRRRLAFRGQGGFRQLAEDRER